MAAVPRNIRPETHQQILEYQAIYVPGLKKPGLGTQADDKQSWNTKLDQDQAHQGPGSMDQRPGTEEDQDEGPWTRDQ